MDTYKSYAELSQYEAEDKDYTILFRDLSSKLLVMAPHGGGIEPGTIDIADELAGCEYSFYGFKGLKKSGNLKLHLSSSNFDEPIGLEAACRAEIVMAIHGARDQGEMVLVGGANNGLKQVVVNALSAAGFNAEICERPGLQGINPDNICNRCRTKKGVQLELSRGFRETLYDNLADRYLRKKTKRFYQFVEALRGTIKAAEY